MECMYSVEAVSENLADSLLLIIQFLNQVGIEAYRVELEVIDLVSLQVRRNGGWVDV